MGRADKFLVEHLRLWKAEGIPAPANELQSVAAWLRCLGEHGEKETANRMRMRMLLLMDAAEALHKAGPQAEAAARIYENRPDLQPLPAPPAAKPGE